MQLICKIIVVGNIDKWKEVQIIQIQKKQKKKKEQQISSDQIVVSSTSYGPRACDSLIKSIFSQAQTNDLSISPRGPTEEIFSQIAMLLCDM